MIEKVKKTLFALKEKKYQEFSSKLIPNCDNMLGVRISLLRKMALEISKTNHQDYFNENDDEFFELTMIEGLLIGYLKINFDEKLSLIKKFIPKIKNWSVCDAFCSNLKIVNKNKENFKIFLENYFNSKDEFELRFCYVILLNFYVKDELDYVLDKISKFTNDFYYSKMAVAWCLSYCFINDFNKTLNYLKNLKIDNKVIKKGITKAIESFRITKEQKELLKEVRKNFS